VYFTAQTAAFTGNVYQWNAASGTSTLMFSGGGNADVQTDGVRVAWETAPAGNGCNGAVPCALTALDIATSATQQLSQDVLFPGFYLGGGVLAWYESSSSLVGGIKASPAPGAPIQQPSAAASAKLYGAGGGYVLYLDLNGKLYAWNTATSSAQLLLDAAPGVAFISGKTVWFTNGKSQALYQVVLP
jgi:hypothetical protein